MRYKKSQHVSTETVFAAIGFILAAFAIWGMFDAAKDVLDREALYKNYLARDLALIMDAIYAAPGDIGYTYTINPKHPFFVRIREGSIDVSGEQDFKQDETFSYRFATDKAISFQFTDSFGEEKLPEYDELLKNPMKIRINKKTDLGKAMIEAQYTQK
ncbi:hypothetical protein HYU12_02900 [Candidatus Woesearchaeota archaeon]|nr:hypothetical protein [Candidatus Woesearchaeota archaeon]